MVFPSDLIPRVLLIETEIEAGDWIEEFIGDVSLTLATPVFFI
jgi:hypothetical protein